MPSAPEFQSAVRLEVVPDGPLYLRLRTGADGEDQTFVFHDRDQDVVFVRQRCELDSDEDAELGQHLRDGDLIVPMVSLSHLSLQTASDPGPDDDMLFSARIVPDGPDAYDTVHRTVYIRMLMAVEEDNGIPVYTYPGGKVTLRRGALTVSYDDLFKRFSRSASLAPACVDTIAVWAGIALVAEAPEELAYLVAAAQKLDGACRALLRAQDKRALLQEEGATGGPSGRPQVYAVLDDLETCISKLSRAFRMIREAPQGIAVPHDFADLSESVEKMLRDFRDAYEHIEDRSRGLVRGSPDPEARSIFNPVSQVIGEGRLTYKGHVLTLDDLERLLLEAQSAIRGCVLSLIDLANDVDSPDETTP